MWQMNVLKKVTDALKPNGLLVTYCAKGQLRRDLLSLNLKVERLPGPPGKREMIRAIKV
jgi:tRNA U34 5-methylaminomethyl-2-thiouridine-forming methyltransferase MnmC